MPASKNRLFGRIYEKCRDSVLCFKNDQGGNIALLFAATIIPTMIAVGAAIDYSRASQVKTAMQTALDSTALHLGLLPQSTSQSVLETEATNYFAANYQGDSSVNLGVISVVKDGPTVTLTVGADLPTLFMGIATINEMDVGARSEVMLGGGTIEIALVLDNSGSMSGAKLSALKTAARGLVETLYDALPPNSTDLSFSLIPFATFVDIGESHANAFWMDRFGQSSIHNENFDTPANRFELYNNITNVQWEGCVEARPYPLDVRDTAPDPGNPDTLFVPSFAPDHPDNAGPNSKYRNRYVPDLITGSWHRRQENVAKYAPGVTATPGYYGTTYNIGPSFLCRQSNLTPLTPSQSVITSGLSNMVARGNTNIVQGLAWGWRTLSPGEPFTEGRPYSDNRNQKILILLTDGQNWLSGLSGNPNNSLYSAYGYAKAERLGTPSSSNVTLTRKMNERTAEICENIKATDGILVYAITFDLNDTATLQLMKDCAESPAFYYNSPSVSDLDAVFEEIAAKLLKLRISK